MFADPKALEKLRQKLQREVDEEQRLSSDQSEPSPRLRSLLNDLLLVLTLQK